MKMKLYNLLILMFASGFIFWGCKKKEDAEKSIITVKGSDTMVNLSQKWAEVYMQQNPNVSVQVTGGGSGTGVASLLNGTTNIANSSRELKKDELDKAMQQGITPKVYEVALDGIAVIVHPENPVNVLTLSQVSDIFTGKIKNWREVGGSNMEITLYGRENSSGTYEFFREHVLGKNDRGVLKDYAVNTQVLQGTAALGEAVAKDNKGIGYGGVGYFAERNDVKVIQIKKDENSEPISPVVNGKVNYDAVWDGSYSISRYLYCFTDGKPSPQVENFLNFIISNEGQALVREMEYIPLPVDTSSVNN
jgi:phosphate transport system substrate-binding protein